MDEQSTIERIWELCNRHGQQVNKALKSIQNLFDNPYERKTADSLLAILADQPYFKEPVDRLIESICGHLEAELPIAFRHELPKDEIDLNDKIGALIMNHGDDYEREYPGIRFALTTAIPDHSFHDHELFIETKYVRANTTPSKASEGIAADITKYASNDYKLFFIVYDPRRAIVDDNRFCKDLEKSKGCVVRIIR